MENDYKQIIDWHIDSAKIWLKENDIKYIIVDEGDDGKTIPLTIDTLIVFSDGEFVKDVKYISDFSDSLDMFEIVFKNDAWDRDITIAFDRISYNHLIDNMDQIDITANEDEFIKQIKQIMDGTQGATRVLSGYKGKIPGPL